MPSIGDIAGLQQSLSAAEQELSSNAASGGPSTGSQAELSEGRDNIREASATLDELEHVSNVSGPSAGTMNSVPGQKSQTNDTDGDGKARGVVKHGGKSGMSETKEVIKMRNEAIAKAEAESVGSKEIQGLDSSITSSLNQTQKEAVDRLIADMMAKQKAELLRMQDKLNLAERTQTAAGIRAENLWYETPATADVQESLFQARKAKDETEDQRDDMKAHIAGLEAKHNVQLDQLQQEVTELQKLNKDSNEESKLAHAAEITRIQEELRVARKAGKAAKDTAEANEKELDEINQQAEQEKKEKGDEIREIQALIHQTEAKIGKKEETIEEKEQDDRWLLDFSLQRVMEKELKEMQESNRSVNQELLDGRLHMLKLKVGFEQDKANLQKKIDAEKAALVLHAASAGGSTLREVMKTADDKVAGEKLRAVVDDILTETTVPVEHDHELAKSVKVVDPRKMVAKLEEKAAFLKEEVRLKQQENLGLQASMAFAKAEQAERLERACQMLKEERNAEWHLSEKVDLVKVKGNDENFAIKKELTWAQQILEDIRGSKAYKQTEQEKEFNLKAVTHTLQKDNIKEQIVYTQEMIRIDGVRLQDTKLELTNMEARHQRMITDLTSKLHFYETGGTPFCDEQSDAPQVEDVMEKMKHVEEDRNRLVNDLEWKEVHWISTLEACQTQHAADREKIRSFEELLETEKARQKQLQMQLASKEGMLEAAGDSKIKKPAPLPVAAPVSPTWLEQFLSWCIGGSGGNPNEASVQLAAWQMLTCMSGVIALCCRAETLEILEASKSAYALWGSSTLHGSTLVDLLPDKNMVDWLSKRLKTAGADIQDFQLKQFPCVSLRDQKGGASEFSLVCASLPAERHHSNDSAVIVVANEMMKG